MNSSVKVPRLKKILKLNLPAIGFLIIMAFLALLETALFENLRTETMLGWIFLVIMPLAILLGLVQIFLWFRLLAESASPKFKRSLQLVFLAGLSAFALFIILRWTM
jgi:hypothetical protein